MFAPTVDSLGRICIDATGRVTNCCGDADPPLSDLRLANCEVVDCDATDVLLAADTIFLRLPPEPRCINPDGTLGRFLAPGDVVVWAGICWRVTPDQSLDGPLLQRTAFECTGRCDDAICTATKYLPVVPCPATEQLQPPPDNTGWVCAARALAKFAAGECPIVDVPILDAYDTDPGPIGGLPPNTPTLCYQALLTDAVLDDDLPPGALMFDGVSAIHANCCECSARYEGCRWQDFTGQPNWRSPSICCIDCATWTATGSYVRRVQYFNQCFPFPTGDTRYAIWEETGQYTIGNNGNYSLDWTHTYREERCNGSISDLSLGSGTTTGSVSPCIPDPSAYQLGGPIGPSLTFDGLQVPAAIQTSCASHSVRRQGSYTQTLGGDRTGVVVVYIEQIVSINAQEGNCGPLGCTVPGLTPLPPPIFLPDLDPIDILNAAGVL